MASNLSYVHWGSDDSTYENAKRNPNVKCHFSILYVFISNVNFSNNGQSVRQFTIPNQSTGRINRFFFLRFAGAKHRPANGRRSEIPVSGFLFCPRLGSDPEKGPTRFCLVQRESIWGRSVLRDLRALMIRLRLLGSTRDVPE